MRLAGRFALAAGLAASAAVLLGGSGAQAGYWCSPGFEATYGGRCVATAATDQVELYLNDAGEVAPEGPAVPLHRRHHHRRAIHERY